MSQVIVYTNEMDLTSVCYPTGELPIDVLQARAVPEGVQSFIIDEAALPTNANDFFNAWVQTNGVVTVSMDKAKDLTKARLRYERTPLLAAQDVLFQRALEAGADTAAIVAEKQRLRDITSLPDVCATLDELRALHC